MRTGQIEANLVRLNDEFRLPQVPDLIARKICGTERGTLAAAELDFHRAEFLRLVGQLDASEQPICSKEGSSDEVGE
jgi:hypothetical protein